MLYKIAHLLRDHLPWIWEVIGMFNSWLFCLRYHNKLRLVDGILSKYTTYDFKIVPLDFNNVMQLVTFFQEQPLDAFTFFHPHGFDKESLDKLAGDNSFLAYLVVTKSLSPVVVGYFFMRSFFWGKCFRGYMTDYRWRRRGINKLMNSCATDIALLLKIRTFGSISPDNIASLKSAQSANQVKIIKTMSNGDYFVEYLPLSDELNGVTNRNGL